MSSVKDDLRKQILSGEQLGAVSLMVVLLGACTVPLTLLEGELALSSAAVGVLIALNIVEAAATRNAQG